MMAYEIEFEERPGYLFARVTGDNTSDTVLQYTQDVADKCADIGCFRVLIHECLEGPRLSGLEIFDLMDEGSKRAFGKFETAMQWISQDPADA